MKKIALLLTLSVLIIGCSKAEPKQDVITKTETTVVQQEVKTLEETAPEVIEAPVEKVEPEKMEVVEKIAQKPVRKKATVNPDIKMTKIVEPSADSIDNIVQESVDEKIIEDESSSKAVEKTAVEEPVTPEKEKSSKGFLFGFGALAAAVLVYFVSKKK